MGDNGEPVEYSAPELEGSSLSCAARDWHLIPPDIAAKFGPDTKTLDLSYNLLEYLFSPPLTPFSGKYPPPTS